MPTSQDQTQTPAIRCPRCGGFMRKPMGSSFYWHADNNHPRCEITNLADFSIEGQTADESVEEPFKKPGGR